VNRRSNEAGSTPAIQASPVPDRIRTSFSGSLPTSCQACPQALCQADDLLTAPSPTEALAVWLRALVAHVATYRGLATWLMSAPAGPGWALGSCQESIRAAGTALLDRAQQHGTVRPDISAPQLLRLTNAIALVTEQTPEDTGPLLSLLMDALGFVGES
jgi:hypothetical protein